MKELKICSLFARLILVVITFYFLSQIGCAERKWIGQGSVYIEFRNHGELKGEWSIKALDAESGVELGSASGAGLAIPCICLFTSIAGNDDALRNTQSYANLSHYEFVLTDSGGIRECRYAGRVHSLTSGNRIEIDVSENLRSKNR